MSVQDLHSAQELPSAPILVSRTVFYLVALLMPFGLLDPLANPALDLLVQFQANWLEAAFLDIWEIGAVFGLVERPNTAAIVRLIYPMAWLLFCLCFAFFACYLSFALTTLIMSSGGGDRAQE